jgi:hypothetical protein
MLSSDMTVLRILVKHSKNIPKHSKHCISTNVRKCFLTFVLMQCFECCTYVAGHTMHARIRAIQARVKSSSLSRAVEAAPPAPLVMRAGMSRRVVAPAPEQAPRAVLTYFWSKLHFPNIEVEQEEEGAVLLRILVIYISKVRRPNHHGPRVAPG